MTSATIMTAAQFKQFCANTATLMRTTLTPAQQEQAAYALQTAQGFPRDRAEERRLRKARAAERRA